MTDERQDPSEAGGAADVAGLAARFAAAWNVHDARAFAALFAPDADFTNVVGVQVTGRAAIERLHARVFATVFRDSQLSIETTRTRPLGRDLFAADVSWSMTGARTQDDHVRPPRYGVMALVLRGSGEALEIEVMHNLEVSSPRPTGAS
ncbi:MAG: SgcJ/EcaC family oxidoreductase [Candidatus Limnocylindrales bacterium]